RSRAFLRWWISGRRRIGTSARLTTCLGSTSPVIRICGAFSAPTTGRDFRFARITFSHGNITASPEASSWTGRISRTIRNKPDVENRRFPLAFFGERNILIHTIETWIGESRSTIFCRGYSPEKVPPLLFQPPTLNHDP